MNYPIYYHRETLRNEEYRRRLRARAIIKLAYPDVDMRKCTFHLVNQHYKYLTFIDKGQEIYKIELRKFAVIRRRNRQVVTMWIGRNEEYNVIAHDMPEVRDIPEEDMALYK